MEMNLPVIYELQQLAQQWLSKSCLMSGKVYPHVYCNRMVPIWEGIQKAGLVTDLGMFIHSKWQTF